MTGQILRALGGIGLFLLGMPIPTEGLTGTTIPHSSNDTESAPPPPTPGVNAP